LWLQDVWTFVPKITVRHETAFDGLGATAQGQPRVDRALY
jgi:hypothetical protein